MMSMDESCVLLEKMLPMGFFVKNENVSCMVYDEKYGGCVLSWWGRKYGGWYMMILFDILWKNNVLLWFMIVES